MDTSGKLLWLAALIGMAHAIVQPHSPVTRKFTKKNKNQVAAPAAVAVVEEEDHSSQHILDAAERGVNTAKYFMFQHVPHHDHYEFGHHRGNDNHFTERFERAHPHHGRFQTKARWGDKHGGYGEHYWDYNHAGHHGDDDDGTNEDAAGDGSSPTSIYQPEDNEGDSEKKGRGQKSKEDTETARLSVSGLDLSYDPATGFVTNEVTGQRFTLTPTN